MKYWLEREMAHGVRKAVVCVLSHLWDDAYAANQKANGSLL